MNVEFVKFYEINRKGEELIGTLHVRLPEFGLNIKGIYLSKRKDHWFFSLPNRKGFDKSLGREVCYSVIQFDERVKNDAFLKTIRKEGRLFVEDYLKANPKIPPQEQQSGKEQLSPSPLYNSVTAVKKPPSTAKPVQASNIAKKVWSDPPPIKKRLPRSLKHG